MVYPHAVKLYQLEGVVAYALTNCRSVLLISYDTVVLLSIKTNQLVFSWS